MKAKRVLGLVLTMVFVMSLLAGCGGQKVGKSDKYVIDWYLVTGNPPASTEPVEKAVNEYLEGKLDAELKLHYLDWATYDQKVNTMMAGGEKFDICYTQGTVYTLAAARNAFIELDELIDQYAPKTRELIGEDFLNGVRVNGKLYGIPANKDKGGHFGIVYRKDIAEKLNLMEQIENVKTLEDFYPVLDVVKEKAPELVPLVEEAAGCTASLLPYDDIIFPVAFNVESDSHKVVNRIEEQATRDAYRKATEHMRRGYLKKGYDATTKKHFASFSQLKPGKAEELSDSKYKWGQIDLTVPFMGNQNALGSIMAISRTSKNPEICMQFLEMVNTDKNLNNLVIFGIEGQHYEKIDENTIRPIPNSGYGNVGMQWEFGNTFINYLVEGEAPDKNEKMLEYNENLVALDSLGFVVDTKAIESEVAACQSVREEFKERVVEGNEDVDNILDQYIAKLKAAGSDRIVAEVQKQFDNWMASKK